MKNSIKNKILSIISYASVGVIMVSATIVSTVYIVKSTYKKSANSAEFIKWGEFKSRHNSKFGYDIVEYPYDTVSNQYWLDDKGLKLLEDTLDKKIYHGQEIRTLNRIIIGNRNVIDDKANGLYYPSTHEIFLNVEQWKDYNSLDDTHKINGMLSTISHEYGHHIANMYLTTSKNNDSKFHWKGDQGKEIKDSSGNLLNWTNNFTESFYRNFGYDNKTLDKKTKKSVFNKISPYDLFWNANDKKISEKNWKLIKNHDYFGWFSLHSNTIFGNTYTKQLHNTYRYSMDEIFTRQLGQLMHVQDLKTPYKETILQMNYDEKNVATLNSWTLDALSNNDIDIKGPQNVTVTSRADSIWLGQRARKFYELMLTTLGYGDTISNIYNTDKKNIKKDADGSTRHDIIQQSKGYMVSGWVPNSVDHISVGGKTYEIETDNLWNWKGKTKLFPNNNQADMSPQAPTQLKPYISKAIPFVSGNKIIFGTGSGNSFKEIKIVNPNKINKNIPVSIFKQDLNSYANYGRITYNNNEWIYNVNY